MTGIGVIGDSLTYQGGQGAQRIIDAFKTAGHDVTNIGVNGLTGRGIAGTAVRPSTLEVIQQWRFTGFDPGTYLIALGTNNRGDTAAHWRRDIGKVLTEIGPGKAVHWIGLAFRGGFDPRAEQFDRVLWELQIDGRLTGHSWEDYIHDGRDQTGLWLPSDPNGVHMTKAGYDIRNAYYAACVPVAAEGAA